MSSNMKLYPNITANLTYQDYGTSWLLVLRGKKLDIELLFNALYNFGAVEKSAIEFNETEDEVTVWSNEDKTWNCFYYVFLNRLLNRGHKDCVFTEDVALAQAQEAFTDFLENHRESRTLYRYNKPKFVDTYDFGKLTAERPDADMKDAILSHAFHDKVDVNSEIVKEEVVN